MPPTKTLTIEITDHGIGVTGNVDYAPVAAGQHEEKVVCAMHVGSSITKLLKGDVMRNDTGSNEKSCIRCTKPASIEKIRMDVTKYVDMKSREQIDEEWHSAESIVYLCSSCGHRELAYSYIGDNNGNH